MSKLLLLVVLLSLGLGSCSPARHSASAPRPWIKYYHRQQRKQERQRRQQIASWPSGSISSRRRF